MSNFLFGNESTRKGGNIDIINGLESDHRAGSVLNFKLCSILDLGLKRATASIFDVLTDTGEDSKLVHRRKRPKVDTLFSSLFFWRVRATSMTQRRFENTRVHFWTFSAVSVNECKSFRTLPQSKYRRLRNRNDGGLSKQIQSQYGGRIFRTEPTSLTIQYRK